MQSAQAIDPDTGTATPISALALGCSRIGSFNNPTPMKQIRALLDRALDLGVTVFDTADVYGQGDSEIEIGRAVRGRRDQAFVVTKAGKRFSAKMRLLRPLKPVIRPLLKSGAAREAVTAQRQASIGQDFSAARLPSAVDASLRRFGFDHIDGFLLHSPPAEVAADPAVAEVLARLKASGKVRHFGVSCDDLDCLKAALRMPGLSLLQLPLDVIDQAGDLAAEIVERRIAVFAREVIRMQPGLTATEAVVAASRRPAVSSVIAGTSNPVHLEALAKALA